MGIDKRDTLIKKPRQITGARYRMFGAGNQIRTGDPNLGKVVLYQLSYSRKSQCAIL